MRLGHGPSVTVVVDGMYGSCGKGVIVGYLSNEYDVAVRVGAPNAGHTLVVGKNTWKMQQLPVCGLVNHDMTLCIGAAGLINETILKREMAYMKDIESRLIIDRNAGIVEHKHVDMEEKERMFEKVGSTCEGIGAALRHKIMRDGTFKTAKDIPWLKPYIGNVALFINKLHHSKKVIIEGTQGYALSLNHGPYPYCTSRDIIAASLLSDVGIPPSSCHKVIMVLRTYPIRVAGNSGPMCGKELKWADIQKRGHIPHDLELREKTTVTKRIRRVCEFDMELVKEACLLNRPTELALTFVDYLDYKNYGVRKYEKLTKKSREFIEKIEKETGVPITLIKTGIRFEDIIDRRADVRKEWFDEGIHQQQETCV